MLVDRARLRRTYSSTLRCANVCSAASTASKALARPGVAAACMSHDEELKPHNS